MRILITNAYCSRNKGDAAILLGMLADLGSREPFRGADFRISTAAYPEDAGEYPCPVVSSFHTLKRQLTPNPLLQGLGFLVLILPWSVLWAWFWKRWHVDLWAPQSWRELFRQYAETDLVVAAGGGYLYSRSVLRGNVILLITVCCFWFAHHIGKPVYLYAQSIGPFRSCFQEMIVRRALRKLQLVIVREEISLKLVSSWNLQCPVRMAADAAFLLPQPKPSDLTVRFPPHSCCVGITVRKWARAAKAQEHFERAMVQFLDWITTSGETIVVLVPQVTVAAWDDDDRNVMRRLYAQSHMKNRVILVEDELSPLHVKALCGAMDFFVGTRMHSNIFALSMGVPTLAIGYQPKSAGIMQQLGLERWVIPWENVAFHRLKAAFEDLAVNAEEVRTALYQKLPDVIRKARLNSHWIAEISIAAGTKGAAPHG